MLKWTSGGSLNRADSYKDCDVAKIQDGYLSASQTLDQSISSLTDDLNIMDTNLNTLNKSKATEEQDKTGAKQIIGKIDRDVKRRDRSQPPCPRDNLESEMQDSHANIRKRGLLKKFKNMFRRSSSKGPSTKSAPNSPTSYGTLHQMESSLARNHIDGRLPSSSSKGRRSRLERLIDANRDNRGHKIKEFVHETQTTSNTGSLNLSGDDDYHTHFVSYASNKKAIRRDDILNINAQPYEKESLADQHEEKQETLATLDRAQWNKQSTSLENKSHSSKESKRKKFTANSVSTLSDTCVLPTRLQRIANVSYSQQTKLINRKTSDPQLVNTDEMRKDFMQMKKHTEKSRLRPAKIVRSPTPESVYFSRWLDKIKEIDALTLHKVKRSLKKTNIREKKFTWTCSQDGSLVVSPYVKLNKSYPLIPQTYTQSPEQSTPRNNNNGHKTLNTRKDNIDLLAMENFRSFKMMPVDKCLKPSRKSLSPSFVKRDTISLNSSPSWNTRLNSRQKINDKSRVKRIVHSLEEKISETSHVMLTLTPTSSFSTPTKLPLARDVTIENQSKTGCTLSSKNEQTQFVKEVGSSENSPSSGNDFLRSHESISFQSQGFEPKIIQLVNYADTSNDLLVTANDGSVKDKNYLEDKEDEIDFKTINDTEQELSMTQTDMSVTTHAGDNSISSIFSETILDTLGVGVAHDSFEPFVNTELQQKELLVPTAILSFSSLSSLSSQPASARCDQEWECESEAHGHDKFEYKENVDMSQSERLKFSSAAPQNENPERIQSGRNSLDNQHGSVDFGNESESKGKFSMNGEILEEAREEYSPVKISANQGINIIFNPEEFGNSGLKQRDKTTEGDSANQYLNPDITSLGIRDDAEIIKDDKNVVVLRKIPSQIQPDCKISATEVSLLSLSDDCLPDAYYHIKKDECNDFEGIGRDDQTTSVQISRQRLKNDIDSSILLQSHSNVNVDLSRLDMESGSMGQSEVNAKADIEHTINIPECIMQATFEKTIEELANSKDTLDDVNVSLISLVSSSFEDKAVMGLSFSSSDITSCTEEQSKNTLMRGSDSLYNLSIFPQEHESEQQLLPAPTVNIADISEHNMQSSIKNIMDDNGKNGQNEHLLLSQDQSDVTHYISHERILQKENEVIDKIKQEEKIDSTKLNEDIVCEDTKEAISKNFTEQQDKTYTYTNVAHEVDTITCTINIDEVSACTETIKTPNSVHPVSKLTSTTQSDCQIGDLLPAYSSKLCDSCLASIDDWNLTSEFQCQNSQDNLRGLVKHPSCVNSGSTSPVSFATPVRRTKSVLTCDVGTSTTNNLGPTVFNSACVNADNQEVPNDVIIYKKLRTNPNGTLSDSKVSPENVSSFTDESLNLEWHKKLHSHESSSVDENELTLFDLRNGLSGSPTFLAEDCFESDIDKATCRSHIWENTTTLADNPNFLTNMSEYGWDGCYEPYELMEKEKKSQESHWKLRHPAHNERKCSEINIQFNPLSSVDSEKEVQAQRLNHHRQIESKYVKKTNMTSKIPRLKNRRPLINRNVDECTPLHHTGNCVNYENGRQVGSREDDNDIMLTDDDESLKDDKIPNDEMLLGMGLGVNEDLKNECFTDKRRAGLVSCQEKSPKQWLFLATVLFFQFLIHWLYAR